MEAKRISITTILCVVLAVAMVVLIFVAVSLNSKLQVANAKLNHAEQPAESTAEPDATDEVMTLPEILGVEETAEYRDIAEITTDYNKEKVKVFGTVLGVYTMGSVSDINERSTVFVVLHNMDDSSPKTCLAMLNVEDWNKKIQIGDKLYISGQANFDGEGINGITMWMLKDRFEQEYAIAQYFGADFYIDADSLYCSD